MEGIISRKIYGPSEYGDKSWAGGQTQELFIYPRESSYDQQDFIFRLSRATIEKEETTFTSLENYDRTLMVLEGEVILSFEGNRVCRLARWEQDQFDGKETTRSFGKLKDYNLMVLKGNLGMLEALQLEKKRRDLNIPKEFTLETFDGLSLGLYCAQGYLMVTLGGDIIRVNQGEQLIVQINLEDPPILGVMGEGTAIKSLIAYNNQPYIQEIPRAKAIMKSDIKAAFFIAYTNFRGSSHIFKSQRGLWYDPPLKKAINRIERIYLPMLIFILGLLVVIYAGMQIGEAEDLWKGVVIWAVLDLLIVTPGLFLFTLPRPIRDHMKRLEDLTACEKKQWEKEKASNVRLEKLLKKYAISGRNIGDQHEGRDYKSFRKEDL